MHLAGVGAVTVVCKVGSGEAFPELGTFKHLIFLIWFKILLREFLNNMKLNSQLFRVHYMT